MKIRQCQLTGSAWSIANPGQHRAPVGTNPSIGANDRCRDVYVADRQPAQSVPHPYRRDRVDRNVDSIVEHLALAQASRNPQGAIRHLRVAERLWHAERSRESQSQGRRLQIQRDLQRPFEMARTHVENLRAGRASQAPDTSRRNALGGN